MWKLTEWATTRAGVTGVPWRDLSDEEFAEAEAQFEPGVLLERGYFEHVEDRDPGQIASPDSEPYFEHEAADAAPGPTDAAPDEGNPLLPPPAPSTTRPRGARRGDR